MTATEIEHTHPCWVLAYPNGDRVDYDGEPHFAREKDATDQVARHTHPELGVPKPEQLTEPCVTISCSCCGTTFDEDEGQIEHHPSIESIHSVVKGCGWTVHPDGAATCGSCSGECDCKDDAPASLLASTSA